MLAVPGSRIRLSVFRLERCRQSVVAKCWCMLEDTSDRPLSATFYRDLWHYRRASNKIRHRIPFSIAVTSLTAPSKPPTPLTALRHCMDVKIAYRPTRYKWQIVNRTAFVVVPTSPCYEYLVSEFPYRRLESLFLDWLSVANSCVLLFPVSNSRIKY